MTFTRSQYALAASVAALVVAAPAAFYALQQGDFKPVSEELSANFRKDPPVTPGNKLKSKPDASGPANVDTKIAANVPAEPAPAAALQPSAGDAATIPAPPVSTTAPAAEGGRIATGREMGAQSQVSGNIAVPGYASAGPSAVAPAKPEALKPAQDLVAGLTPYDLSKTAKESAQDLQRLGAIGAAAPQSQTYNPYGHFDEDRRRQAIFEQEEHDQFVLKQAQEERDRFEAKDINPVKQVATEPVSTFSIDVDTASYSFVRRALNSGHLPPKASVRVEEMINYFPYAYPRPETAETPFKPTISVMPSPWNPANQLVHVAIKGYDLQSAERPRANLVFLIDISGSMDSNDKLPLVKNAFRMLVDELKPDDSVGIVTYASGSGVLLEPTRISDKRTILAAIDRLGAGGSTAGAEGIQDAYRLAEESFDAKGVNRIVLATDGDFNVGITDQEALKGLIERKREKGIFLSILGVGQGNYNDSLMQTLAQNGNGTAAYVDTLNEARKVLVDEASSTLFTIAKDVKVQIEWNPARVSEYRLIGYETRALKREDFNNDRVDAGDIGSGHTVTAIYEITPANAEERLVDDLRYKKLAQGPAPTPAADTKDGEIGFLKLRYKLPKEDASKLVTLAISDTLAARNIGEVSQEARFSVAVAAFGQLLRGAPYLKSFGYDDVVELAAGARGNDPFGYRAEFLSLVRLAKSARP